MVFVDLHLYTEERSKNSEELFNKFRSNIDYVFFLHKEINPVFIQHADFTADFFKEDVKFIVKKGVSSKFNFFISLFFEIRKYKPSVVLMHSMLQPWLILIATLIFGRRTKIIVQNHADKPRKGIKLLCQRLAGNVISKILFVSEKQAEEWIEKRIVARHKVFELMEGSTSFRFNDKTLAKASFEATGKLVFLWVGRLDANKDPLTVLKAFKEYSQTNTLSELWMIYGTTDLYNKVVEFVNFNRMLNVRLIGTLPHASLERYFNAADYFILGSHSEGSGYALCEAMACGCIPIVTNIPSFVSITDNGDAGYLFEPGNDNELLNCLRRLKNENQEEMRRKVLAKFNSDLSFQAIGSELSLLLKNLNVSYKG